MPDGPPCGFLCRLPLTDRLGREENKTFGVLLFMLTQIGCKGMEIVSKLLSILLPDTPHFFNYWVRLHG